MLCETPELSSSPLVLVLHMFQFHPFIPSWITKPDTLTTVSGVGDGNFTRSESILSSCCLVGAVSWLIEEGVKAASQAHPGQSSFPDRLLFVPAHLRSEVLRWAHFSRLTCHPGVHRTLKFLQHRFWWPAVAKDVQEFVSACPVCCQHKPSHPRPAGLLQPLSIPKRPWS